MSGKNNYFSVARPFDGTCLNIAIISKSDAEGGGASRMAAALAKMLNQCENITAHHWMGYPGKELKPHMRSLYGGLKFRSFQIICRMFSQLIGFPDFLTPEIFYLWNRKDTDYHIYHFHDISRTFSPISFRWLARRRPVAWTFRDCTPFTGGCLYPMECKSFHTRCGKCNKLRDWPLQTFVDTTGIMQDYKRATAEMKIFTPVVASRWTAEQAMKSGMFSVQPHIIPNYVDLNMFCPMDKKAIRRKLSLPQDSFIIMMSAPNLDEKRKGAIYALKALQLLKRKVRIVLTGRIRKPNIRRQFQGIPVHDVGYIRDHSLLAKYYAASDIFLFPSLAETFCNAILESMACGTPPIAFHVGAIPELVIHEFNGWLASFRCIDELVKGIQVSFDHPEIQKEWGMNSRQKALKYSQRVFLDTHIELYHQMLNGL